MNRDHAHQISYVFHILKKRGKFNDNFSVAHMCLKLRQNMSSVKIFHVTSKMMYAEQ